MADDYLSEVRGVFLQHVREMNDYGDREETDRVVADEAAEFDRMIIAHDEAVRAEQTDREPSDAEVEAAANAIVEASFGQELPEAPIDLARAALLAAQEVRRG